MSLNLPRLFWVILLIHVILAGIYAIVTPPFEKSDENWHFAMAMYLLEARQLPLNTPDAPHHYAQQQANQPPLYYMVLAPLWRLAGYTALTSGYVRLAKPNEFAGVYDSPFAFDNQRMFIEGRCENICATAKTAMFIGRALSALFVSLSIYISARTMRIIFPWEPALLLMTSAVLAFNPQLLHIGTSVSNDSLTMLLMSAGFYLGACWITGTRDTYQVVCMAIIAGAALLTKLSAGSLGLLFGVIILTTSAQRIKHLLVFGGISLVISGWWFIFNTVNYGDPTAIGIHLSTAPQLGPPASFGELVQQIPAVFRSFWADFGWGNISLVNGQSQLIAGLLLLGFIAGLAIMALRWRYLTTVQRQFLGLLLAAVLITVGLLMRWMTTTLAPHGRLLFPVVFPISLILGMSIIWIFPSHRQFPALKITGAGLLAFAVAMPFTLIIPAYRPVAPVTNTAIQPPLAWFHEQDAGTLALRDIALKETGDWVYVQLGWEIETAFQNDYAVFVHLLDENGHIIRQRDSYPGLSHQSFSRLAVGDVFYDVYPVRRPDVPVKAVFFGVYTFGTWERLRAEAGDFDIDTNGVSIPIDRIRVVSEPPTE